MIFFKESEFVCKCGCGLMPRKELMELADKLRLHFGSPLNVTSGARCRKHNTAVGGAPASNHMKGLAADLAAADMRGLHSFLAHQSKQLLFWYEDPKATPTWAHIQIVPYSGWVSGMPLVFSP